MHEYNSEIVINNNNWQGWKKIFKGLAFILNQTTIFFFKK